MTKQQYKDLENEFGFMYAMRELENECDEVTSYDILIEYAKDCIDKDNLGLAIHILQALNNNLAEFYRYDYSMGLLEEPSVIDNFEDAEDLLEGD